MATPRAMTDSPFLDSNLPEPFLRSSPGPRFAHRGRTSDGVRSKCWVIDLDENFYCGGARHGSS